MNEAELKEAVAREDVPLLRDDILRPVEDPVITRLAGSIRYLNPEGGEEVRYLGFTDTNEFRMTDETGVSENALEGLHRNLSARPVIDLRSSGIHTITAVSGNEDSIRSMGEDERDREGLQIVPRGHTGEPYRVTIPHLLEVFDPQKPGGVVHFDGPGRGNDYTGILIHQETDPTNALLLLVGDNARDEMGRPAGSSPHQAAYTLRRLVKAVEDWANLDEHHGTYQRVFDAAERLYPMETPFEQHVRRKSLRGKVQMFVQVTLQKYRNTNRFPRDLPFRAHLARLSAAAVLRRSLTDGEQPKAAQKRAIEMLKTWRAEDVMLTNGTKPQNNHGTTLEERRQRIETPQGVTAEDIDSRDSVIQALLGSEPAILPEPRSEYRINDDERARLIQKIQQILRSRIHVKSAENATMMLEFVLPFLEIHHTYEMRKFAAETIADLVPVLEQDIAAFGRHLRFSALRSALRAGNIDPITHPVFRKLMVDLPISTLESLNIQSDSNKKLWRIDKLERIVYFALSASHGRPGENFVKISETARRLMNLSRSDTPFGADTIQELQRIIRYAEKNMESSEPPKYDIRTALDVIRYLRNVRKSGTDWYRRPRLTSGKFSETKLKFPEVDIYPHLDSGVQVYSEMIYQALRLNDPITLKLALEEMKQVMGEDVFQKILPINYLQTESRGQKTWIRQQNRDRRRLKKEFDAVLRSEPMTRLRFALNELAIIDRLTMVSKETMTRKFYTSPHALTLLFELATTLPKKNSEAAEEVEQGIAQWQDPTFAKSLADAEYPPRDILHALNTIIRVQLDINGTVKVPELAFLETLKRLTASDEDIKSFIGFLFPFPFFQIKDQQKELTIYDILPTDSDLKEYIIDRLTADKNLMLAILEKFRHPKYEGEFHTSKRSIHRILQENISRSDQSDLFNDLLKETQEN